MYIYNTYFYNCIYLCHRHARQSAGEGVGVGIEGDDPRRPAPQSHQYPWSHHEGHRLR